MADLFYRTEDIKPDDVQKYFVETQSDRDIVNALKGHNPIILSGSRGVGKSFLLRVAEAELMKEMAENHVFPVYVSFSKKLAHHYQSGAAISALDASESLLATCEGLGASRSLGSLSEKCQHIKRRWQCAGPNK